MTPRKTTTLAITMTMACAGVFLLAGCGEPDDDPYRGQPQDRQHAQDDDERREAMRQQGIPAPDNVAAPPADATVTDSGLAYIILEDANGTASPRVSDTVTVHYTGWTTDGRMFDSSVLRGEPATFPLDRLIAGWQEAIPLMTTGDTFRFWIPGELAYDNSPRPDAPRGTLVFDIQLIAIEQDDVQGGGSADPEGQQELERHTDRL